MFSVYKTIFSIIKDLKLNDIRYATSLTKNKKKLGKIIKIFYVDSF